MKHYEIAEENKLLRQLFVLTSRRSMRPSMQENMQMRLIFEQLLLLTDKDEYKI